MELRFTEPSSVFIEFHEQFNGSLFSCREGLIEKGANLELEVGKGLLNFS
jgi:hypothetical protein